MAVLDKVWQVYVGEAWIGTLSPTGSDSEWYYADFAQGDDWGNFAPWFDQAAAAFKAGDDSAWQNWHGQLTAMGLTITADDGESVHNPTLTINGSNAWFVI